MKIPTGQFEWKRRRRIIYAVLVFIAAEIAYLTVWGPDTELARGIAVSLILLAGSVIGSYVFGAVWDDANARKHGGGDGGGYGDS